MTSKPPLFGHKKILFCINFDLIEKVKYFLQNFQKPYSPFVGHLTHLFAYIEHCGAQQAYLYFK